jgi:hypothetical protein
MSSISVVIFEPTGRRGKSWLCPTVVPGKQFGSSNLFYQTAGICQVPALTEFLANL